MFMTYKLLKDFAAKRGYKLINKEYKNEIELRNDDKIITIHTDDYGGHHLNPLRRHHMNYGSARNLSCHFLKFEVVMLM